MKIAREIGLFQPVVLTLVIENEGELCALWHRMNLSHANVEEQAKISSTPVPPYESSKDDNNTLWNALNRIVEERNLRINPPKELGI